MRQKENVLCMCADWSTLTVSKREKERTGDKGIHESRCHMPRWLAWCLLGAAGGREASDCRSMRWPVQCVREPLHSGTFSAEMTRENLCAKNKGPFHQVGLRNLRRGLTQHKALETFALGNLGHIVAWGTSAPRNLLPNTARAVQTGWWVEKMLYTNSP